MGGGGQVLWAPKHAARTRRARTPTTTTFLSLARKASQPLIPFVLRVSLSLSLRFLRQTPPCREAGSHLSERDAQPHKPIGSATFRTRRGEGICAVWEDTVVHGLSERNHICGICGTKCMKLPFNHTWGVVFHSRFAYRSTPSHRVPQVQKTSKFIWWAYGNLPAQREEWYVVSHVHMSHSNERTPVCYRHSGHLCCRPKLLERHTGQER